MKQPELTKGYLFAILSAVLYGCMPLMASYIYDSGTNPMTLVFLRNCLALPILALLALRQHKTLAVPPKALPAIGLISAMGCCVTPILLFSSYRFIPSGTATVFHFIYPAAVVLGGILFLRKNVRLGNILGVALCVIGVSLFYTPGQALDWRGSLLALLSGISFAVYVLLLPAFRYQDRVSGFLFSFYVAFFSSLLTLILCLVSGQLDLPDTLPGWLLCLLFAFMVTTLAVVLFQQATFLIGAERTSILSTLEPITSVVIGVAVFREALGVRTLMGSVLVISASILIACLDMKKKGESL